MKRKVKKTTMIFICIGAILLAAFASLFIISGIFQTPTYLEPWKKDYSRQFDDPRIKLAAHGLLAANGHNMQPWKIKLNQDNPLVFYLYADSERLTNEVDPFARQMMITQGTFLEYAKIAGEELGYQAEVEFFPEGSYDERTLAESMKQKPAAKVTLRKGEPQNSSLYDYMFLPDTNRVAYKSTALTPEQIRQLNAINTDTDLSVKIYQDKENMEKLSRYAVDGAEIEADVSRVMQETGVIFRANEYRKNKYRYGFSVEGQGTSGMMQHIMQGLVTLFPSMNEGKAASDLFIKSTKTSVDNTPAYAMIISKDNSRRNQVKSGMLYSRLILEAHRLGIVMQPLSQVLEEYPEMQEPYGSIHNDYAADGSTIQMLVRMGVPAKEVSLSMRRDVMDLIIKQ